MREANRPHHARRRPRPRPLRFVPAAVSIVAALALSPPADGQPAASPEPLAVEIVGSLVLEAPASHAGVLREMRAVAERTLPRMERDLAVRPRAPFRLLLIPRGTRHPVLAELDAAAPSHAAGFLFPEQRVGAVRLGSVYRYPYDGLATVLVHEIAHQLVHDATGGQVPRWFGEGVATLEGRSRGARDFLVQSRDLMVARLPRLVTLDRQFERPESTRLAYAVSFDFVAWSVRHYGTGFLPEVLALTPEVGFEEAWLEASGVALGESEASWRRATLLVHRWLPALASSGSLWVAITLLFLWVGWLRRRKTRRMYERWDEEERRREEEAVVAQALHEIELASGAESSVDLESSLGPGLESWEKEESEPVN